MFLKCEQRAYQYNVHPVVGNKKIQNITNTSKRSRTYCHEASRGGIVCMYFKFILFMSLCCTYHHTFDTQTTKHIACNQCGCGPICIDHIDDVLSGHQRLSCCVCRKEMIVCLRRSFQSKSIVLTRVQTEPDTVKPSSRSHMMAIAVDDLIPRRYRHVQCLFQVNHDSALRSSLPYIKRHRAYRRKREKRYGHSFSSLSLPRVEHNIQTHSTCFDSTQTIKAMVPELVVVDVIPTVAPIAADPDTIEYEATTPDATSWLPSRRGDIVNLQTMPVVTRRRITPRTTLMQHGAPVVPGDKVLRPNPIDDGDAFYKITRGGKGRGKKSRRMIPTALLSTSESDTCMILAQSDNVSAIEGTRDDNEQENDSYMSYPSSSEFDDYIDGIADMTPPMTSNNMLREALPTASTSDCEVLGYSALVQSGLVLNENQERQIQDVRQWRQHTRGQHKTWKVHVLSTASKANACSTVTPNSPVDTDSESPEVTDIDASPPEHVIVSFAFGPYVYVAGDFVIIEYYDPVEDRRRQAPAMFLYMTTAVVSLIALHWFRPNTELIMGDTIADDTTVDTECIDRFVDGSVMELFDTRWLVCPLLSWVSHTTDAAHRLRIPTYSLAIAAAVHHSRGRDWRSCLTVAKKHPIAMCAEMYCAQPSLFFGTTGIREFVLPRLLDLSRRGGSVGGTLECAQRALLACTLANSSTVLKIMPMSVVENGICAVCGSRQPHTYRVSADSHTTSRIDALGVWTGLDCFQHLLSLQIIMHRLVSLRASSLRDAILAYGSLKSMRSLADVRC
jgi:hypothetical protein